MSAEPGRKTAYSVDLRWRVVWQRLALDLPLRAIASNLSISVGTAHNIFKRFEDTGEVDPKPAPKRKELRKMDDHHELYVVGLVLANPTMQLSEMCSKVQEISGTEVSVSTLCKLLSRHGFTRKRIQHVASQRNDNLRGKFIADVTFFDRDMLVWIDESGCNSKDCLRTYGHSIRGERAISRVLLVRGQRISVIAAMSCKGILDIELTTGTVNGDTFFDFVRGTLIPQMQPFDGCSPMSVAIMDNCSIHHVSAVTTLFQEAGILLIFLPPYSPDYNPIECVFGYVKSYLKKHQDIRDAFPNPCALVKAGFDAITSEHCNAWISDSGYT